MSRGVLSPVARSLVYDIWCRCHTAKRVLLRGRVCTGVRHTNAVATSDRCKGGPKQELPQNAEICQHQLTIRNWHVTAGARSV